MIVEFVDDPDSMYKAFVVPMEGISIPVMKDGSIDLSGSAFLSSSDAKLLAEGLCVAASIADNSYHVTD